jgi:hypothetical protein
MFFGLLGRPACIDFLEICGAFTWTCRVRESNVNLERLLARKQLVALGALDRKLARVDVVGVALQVRHLHVAVDANAGTVDLGPMLRFFKYSA